MDLKDLHQVLGSCSKCIPFSRQLEHPFLGLGNLDANIVFVGERPAYQTRQKNGLVFCGSKSGDFFLDVLSEIGINFTNAYFTNAIKCQKHGNQEPRQDEMSNCAPYLKFELELIKPELVVCLGAVAAKAVQALGPRYKAMPIRHPQYIRRFCPPKSAEHKKWQSQLQEIAGWL